MEEWQEELFDKMAALQRSVTVLPQDPLVFVVRGAEVRDLLLKLAGKYERAADEESAGNVKSLRRPSFSGVALPPGVHLPDPPPMAPVYRELAESVRWLADHVEEDRVFKLGLHDLEHLGVSCGRGPMQFGGMR
jgi:hypothetical protein